MYLKETMIKRRSRYDVMHQSSLSDEAIEDLLTHALKHAPSPYNAQHQRAVLLLHDAHHELWELTKTRLKEEVSKDKFPKTEKKLNTFQAAYGTILFFTDQPTLDELQTKFPKYANQFALWIDQSQGMFQWMVWAALAEAGMGASLQHYNPLIDDSVNQTFGIPTTWKLEAQMPFGIAKGEPKEKTFIDLTNRYLVRS